MGLQHEFLASPDRREMIPGNPYVNLQVDPVSNLKHAHILRPRSHFHMFTSPEKTYAYVPSSHHNALVLSNRSSTALSSVT